MKNNFLIYIGCIFFINTCRMPSDPLGEISIIKRLETISTVGECLDIDVDIEDSILVAAANSYGYFVYKINSTGGIVSDISEQKHVGTDEMDNSALDNRAQSVIVSKNHNIAFVMDQYDHIWLYKYGDGATQYSPPNHLEEDCYGGTWLSVAIDDQSSRIGIYTLLKHSSAEFMPYCINSDNLTSIGTDQGCSDIEEYIATEFNTQNACEGASGYIWMFPGCQVGNYAEHSTSLVWKNLEDPPSTSLGGEPDCEYIINQGEIAEKIYFDDGLLSMAYGEQGVRVFQKTEYAGCLIDGEFNNLDDLDDLDDSVLCDDHPSQNSCCESIPCPPAWGIDCGTNDFYVQTNGYPGFGGVYSSAGGITPQIYAEFDTPGKVEAIYSMGNTIFSGLSDSYGCMITILGTDASIISTHQFAIGYKIKGIHQDNGLLALASWSDGILLYNWNGNDVSFIGKIETSAKAYNVKVAGDIIFAATKAGIEIIQIDYTP